jgi:DNA polymerase I-like protein with 3'-5' exonuclease and polymerase domains
VETTTSNKGNPFDETNKLVCVGLKRLDETKSYTFYNDYYGWLDCIQREIKNADLIVGFNIKFDLHWLRKSGINFSGKKIWDCQLGEFILENQKNPYPSLDQAAEKYGLPKKLDVVKNEYWDKGIDTDNIPRNILSEYLNQDLVLTEQVFLKQRELFQTSNKDQFKLFRLHCMDLLILEEMEWNGIVFNTEKAQQKVYEIKDELETIYKEFNGLLGGVPVNLSSNDHVSCILYGGIISEEIRVPIGVYKTGAKTGQTRYKVIIKEYALPRLVDPLEGTEVKKPEGKGQYWKVNDTVLRSLKLNKEAKKIVSLLKRQSELDKLCNTYLIGYPSLITKMNWPSNMIHGTLNQCVTVTGRLSSSKPNLQNVDPITKLFMESRYL